MEKTTGIRFRETMAGGVMCGERDYLKGERKGRVAGHLLAMHASVQIDDLQRFIEDPQHPGRLDGTIDFTPMGEAIPARHGQFNLFTPATRPDTKHMIYELGFEHEGQDYYLAGYKEVRDDPGFDLWSDTTTLYSRIHRGSDATCEIIAAGILTLGMSELMHLLSSMEVTGTESETEKLGALARFGSFFMGELWDSYSGL